MKISPIKTCKIRPYERDIHSVLDQFVNEMPDRSILAVTSKIVSICEGNVVKIGGIEKEELIKWEADLFLPAKSEKYDFLLTIKNGILIPNAGIDESNGDGYYIVWPKNPQKSANVIRDYLANRFRRKNIGVIITDSKTTPLRWGTTGVAIAYSGFSPLRDYIGKPDIFGKKMRSTKANIMDGLAAAAVLAMGEGKEQTPMALIENLPFVRFQNSHPSKSELEDLQIDIEDDLYAELLQSVKWRKEDV